MKKRILALILSLAINFSLLIGIGTIPASALQYDDFTYTDNGTSITITDYTGYGGAVTIPSIINNKPVTSIGPDAFHWSDITGVTIPGSVKSIGISAFNSCTSLLNLTIENGVENIAERAFFSCNSLANFNLPDSILSIGIKAFSHCSSLTTITIPVSVSDMGQQVFDSCFKLVSINVNLNNLNFKSIDGVLFNKTGTTLLVYPTGKSGPYLVPNGVTSIGNYSFYNRELLTGIAIQSGVISIGDYSLYGCKELINVCLPNTLTSIGDYAFAFCDKAIDHIIIPSSVTHIGNGAFLKDMVIVIDDPPPSDPIKNIVTGYTEPRALVTIGSQTFTTYSSNGYFWMPYIDNGNYNLTISKPGALTRTIPITVLNATVVLTYSSNNKIPLIFGDANGDGLINISDIGLAKSGYGDLDPNQNIDFNCDGIINITDIGIAKTNYGKSTSSYTQLFLP